MDSEMISCRLSLKSWKKLYCNLSSINMFVKIYNQFEANASTPLFR